MWHWHINPLDISADIISCVEFNSTGDLLATGDKGGRVVIFQRDKAVRLDIDKDVYFKLHAYICNWWSNMLSILASYSLKVFYLTLAKGSSELFWLKVQMIFSDGKLSVVVVNLSHFSFLLQIHWTNFIKTWHKASLDEWNSNLFKWRALPLNFFRGSYERNSENTVALTKSKV